MQQLSKGKKINIIYIGGHTSGNIYFVDYEEVGDVKFIRAVTHNHSEIWINPQSIKTITFIEKPTELEVDPQAEARKIREMMDV